MIIACKMDTRAVKQQCGEKRVLAAGHQRHALLVRRKDMYMKEVNRSKRATATTDFRFWNGVFLAERQMTSILVMGSGLALGGIPLGVFGMPWSSLF
jgi:hypothetical protein